MCVGYKPENDHFSLFLVDLGHTWAGQKIKRGGQKKLRGGVGWGVNFWEKSAVGQKMPK